MLMCVRVFCLFFTVAVSLFPCYSASSQTPNWPEMQHCTLGLRTHSHSHFCVQVKCTLILENIERISTVNSGRIHTILYFCYLILPPPHFVGYCFSVLISFFGWISKSAINVWTLSAKKQKKHKIGNQVHLIVKHNQCKFVSCVSLNHRTNKPYGGSLLPRHWTYRPAITWTLWNKI